MANFKTGTSVLVRLSAHGYKASAGFPGFRRDFKSSHRHHATRAWFKAELLQPYGSGGRYFVRMAQGDIRIFKDSSLVDYDQHSKVNVGDTVLTYLANDQGHERPVWLPGLVLETWRADRQEMFQIRLHDDFLVDNHRSLVVPFNGLRK